MLDLSIGSPTDCKGGGTLFRDQEVRVGVGHEHVTEVAGEGQAYHRTPHGVADDTTNPEVEEGQQVAIPGGVVGLESAVSAVKLES